MGEMAGLLGGEQARRRAALQSAGHAIVLVQPEMECRAFSTAIEFRPDFIGAGVFKA